MRVGFERFQWLAARLASHTPIVWGDRQPVQVAAGPLTRPPTLGRFRIRSVRRLVHPRRLLRRARRQLLQSRQFVLDRLMLGSQLGKRPGHTSRSPPEAGSPRQSRREPGRSVRLTSCVQADPPESVDIQSLNHTFWRFGFPLRPEICPGYEKNKKICLASTRVSGCVRSAPFKPNSTSSSGHEVDSGREEYIAYISVYDKENRDERPGFRQRARADGVKLSAAAAVLQSGADGGRSTPISAQTEAR